MKNANEKRASSLSRRDFVRNSTVAVAGLAFMQRGNFAYAAGSDTIRYGVVGCGGRGTGAAVNAVESSEGVVLTAIGDLFEDRLDESKAKLKENIGDAYQVAADHEFVGWDNYKHVIDSDVDVVIFATPPVFRPIHVPYAVEKGRHVFMEKPVAVDPAGTQVFFEVAKQADSKGLSIVAGTQRRHERRYLEVMQRIHDGAIGEVLSGQVYWNQGGLWKVDRKPGWSDMEHQVRNWLYYTYLSGDHVVEQHIHNLDVANWAIQDTPVKATGVGGRQERVSPEYGYVFDHFAVDLEYANGARVLSMCRQQQNTARYVGEHFIGSRGTSDAASWIQGENPFRFEGENPNPYVQEHANLIESIRSGSPINETHRMAETNVTAIMVREAAYTGQEVTWDDVINSTQKLTPDTWEFGNVPMFAVAVPGQTELNRRPFGKMNVEAKASG